MSRVLVIEDNPEIVFGLRNSLEISGYDVVVAGDGVEGVERAAACAPDLVVLDLMLPRLDGYRVLLRLRERGLTAPVLVLTARGDEADKVMGFRLGADDYVTKPFGMLELLARVEALLRRARPPAPEPGAPPIRFGDVEIDPAGREVRCGGVAVPLAPREFDLLLALARRPGRVHTRAELLREVWGYDATVVSRTVDTHVAELRAKLETDPARPRHIVTVRREGYKLVP